MDNEYVKKLTGKNQNDYEFAAAHIINNSDIDAFESLVEKSDFLFDFIKENVKKRLLKVITENNYKNLFSFLKIYSYDYEEVIVSSFAKFADEDLTDKMLSLLESGTQEEQAYAAKYFSHINDSLAIEHLRKHSFSDFDALALNCAEALSAMNDDEALKLALEKLESQDDFEKLSAVRFLVAYKAEKMIAEIFNIMKKSSIAENIASEIPYLKSFSTLIDGEFKNDTILALNHILSGFGEIIALAQVFDFEMFDILNKLINEQTKEQDSKVAILLLNAKEKFSKLTENDEYIFDEDKNTKEEIKEINNLLNYQSDAFWLEQLELFQKELISESDFVFFALEILQEFCDKDFTKDIEKLKGLLSSDNQTLVLKTVETIKKLGLLNELDKTQIIESISDSNIKMIINSLFEQ